MECLIHYIKQTNLGGGNLFKQVLLRLVKFYLSFWPVFLIMLAIGVFIFHMPLVEEDAGFLHIVKVFVMNLLGLAGHQSYNATWWYNSLILPLYILSPLLYLCLKRMPFLTLALSVLSVSIQFRVGCDLGRYMFIYLVGMVTYLYKDKIDSYLNRIGPLKIVTLTLLLLLLFAFSLKIIGDPIYSRGIYSYAAIAILLAVVTKTLIKGKLLRFGLTFLGKHSANIYFCHTLIFYYWFPEFFYSIGSPLLIFMLLLLVSVLVSIFFEKLKKITAINALQALVIEKVKS